MHQAPDVAESPSATSITSSHGPIEFDRVQFSYGPHAAALNEVSLKIEPGQRVALVGASGAGKSTILSLILRFYDPQAGAIRLQGHDLRSLSLESLRRQIGIVTQDTFLFHDTIYSNIRFGRPDASQAEVEEAVAIQCPVGRVIPGRCL